MELPFIVIVTVTGTATGLEPDALTVPGTVQAPCGVEPGQASVTGPVNPPRKFDVTVGLAEAPGATETDCVFGEKLKSCPVPVRTTVGVEAFAVTENVVVSVPVSPLICASHGDRSSKHLARDSCTISVSSSEGRRGSVGAQNTSDPNGTVICKRERNKREEVLLLLVGSSDLAWDLRQVFAYQSTEIVDAQGVLMGVDHLNWNCGNQSPQNLEFHGAHP